MTEAATTRGIITLAESLGLLAHWCRDSRHCVGRRGFPDLFIAGVNGWGLAEVKSPDGDVSPDQQYWHWILSEQGLAVPVWTQADLDDGTIESILRGIR